MKPVRLSASQHGLCRDGKLYPRADSHSAASYCCNLRSSNNGKLEPVLTPAILGLIEGRPIGFDRLPDRSILFSQRDDGTICTEGALLSDGSFAKQLTEYANPVLPVTSMSSSGQLLTLSLQDGTLLYMHRTDNEYRWLGQLPDVPSATAEIITTNIAAEGRIESQTFDEVITDARSGITDKIKRELGQQLLDAYVAALEKLHLLGLWHNPVAIRFGYRLHDGSLLSLSAPIPVGLERGIDYCPTANLPLTPAYDNHNNVIGVSGTESQVIELYGYRIRVNCPEIPAVWRDIINNIEMYVCPEPEGVDMNIAPRVNLRQVVGTGTVLNINAARRETSQSYSVFNNGTWYRHSVLAGGSYTVSYRNEKTLPTLTVDEMSEQSFLFGLKAGLLLCHDGIMHFANISRETPLPLPGGYTADENGNATLEPLSLSAETAVGRFSIPESEITETDTGITLHLPLLIWQRGEGAGRFRLSVSHNGSIYECEFYGTSVVNESAWMYLTDGSEGLAMTRSGRSSLPLPVSIREEYPSMVLTTRRGNPLVVASHTTYVGGKVEGMIAQQIGGGAYTRQFIYIFTHTGISALTHSYEGIHTNCRTISPEHVSQPDSLAVATSHGVYALTDTGRLLSLNDARSKTLYHGLGTGWKGLGWNSSTAELWMCHQQESIVLQCADDMLAHVRNCNIDRLLQCGTSLYAADEYRLLDLGTGTERSRDWQWIGMPEPYQPGVPRLLHIPLHGSNLNAEVTIERVADDIEPWQNSDNLADTHRAFDIERVQVQGDLHSDLRIPLHALSARTDTPSVLMRIKIKSKR